VNWQVLRRTAATHFGGVGEAGPKELQVLLRHASTDSFSVQVYQQAIKARVLDVLEKYSQAVASDLPDSTGYTIPVEPEEALAVA